MKLFLQVFNDFDFEVIQYFHFFTVVIKLSKNVFDCMLLKQCQQTPKKMDRGSFDRNSLDQNCVFSVDQKF